MSVAEELAQVTEAVKARVAALEEANRAVEAAVAAALEALKGLVPSDPQPDAPADAAPSEPVA